MIRTERTSHGVNLKQETSWHWGAPTWGHLVDLSYGSAKVGHTYIYIYTQIEYKWDLMGLNGVLMVF